MCFYVTGDPSGMVERDPPPPPPPADRSRVVVSDTRRWEFSVSVNSIYLAMHCAKDGAHVKLLRCNLFSLRAGRPE